MSQIHWWDYPDRPSFPDGLKLSIIVPVYNERYLVGELLRQLLGLKLDRVQEIEILVVDDGSDDGSAAVVEEVTADNPGRIRLIRKERNEGKGSAIRKGIELSTGDLVVIQDSDLEYDPRELGSLVRPFLEDGADVVYGSRFASSERRRVLYFRHQWGNQLITFLSNLFTNLNLTDVETCYKMFRGPLLRSIPIRSDDFAFEIEITAKIAKRNCSVFEVPISYRGRTYHEGKKIGWRDGLRALRAILRYWVIDDLYREDAYGGQILHRLERARRFNAWMAEAVLPWLGHRVLEIGAGIGNMTRLFTPRDLYLATDLKPDYLQYLSNMSAGKPYLRVASLDVESADDFAEHRERFDTVVCLNVLEHVHDPIRALHNMAGALTAGGRLVLYVPRGPRLYSALDEALAHRCRYDRASLRRELAEAGLEVEHLRDFNRVSVPGWWWNGKVLRRRRFSRWQLKVLDLLVPVLRRLDRLWPWPGLGLIAVARRSDGPSAPG